MFPPVPGQADQAPPQAAPNASNLVDAPAASPSSGPSPEQQVGEYMTQIRTLHAAIDALAAQFPAASKSLREAKQALTDSMTAVAGSVTQQNQQQPRTF